MYDVKYLMKSCKNLKGGLQELANELEVQRIGPQHQAGSDSLLTGQTFFKMKEMFFEDDIDDSKYLGHLFGLGMNPVWHVYDQRVQYKRKSIPGRRHKEHGECSKNRLMTRGG